ncbi:MAG: hypothetical protein M5U34_19115 [Chloroflexi bacterium]|nr:hypothetical protein [Chloroflexota bacterium]
MKRVSAEGQAGFETAVANLRAHFTVKTIPVMADFEAIYERHQIIVAAEAPQVHASWFAQYPALYHPKTAA